MTPSRTTASDQTTQDPARLEGTPMSALDLARWQFGITTVYHFLFVPLTIGLSALVAGLQTMWVRTGREEYLRATKFWGKLLLINFAMGVVTGIVQEFQFGMNWSDYSRYVGDIFGAPLAIEGLLAFFLESTFLGLWIFGWDRLPRRVHLACIWLVSIGTILSAFFILAANAWMQHPVGYVLDGGRARLTDFGAVLTNSTAWVAFGHTITAAFVTAGAFVMGVAAWQLVRGRDVPVFRPSMKLGAVTLLLASVAVAVTGDLQARVMTEQQPMKMAAAEALYETSSPASFSLFTIGSLDGSEELFSLRVPSVLSFMATGSTDGTVEGINDLQAAAEQRYGPGDYSPDIPLTYWTFRLMIGFGVLSLLLSAVGLWYFRRGRTPDGSRRAVRWFYRMALIGIAFPMIANSTGWIFTELGRQPWVVYGLLGTADGVSPGVGAGTVATSLVVFTLVYGLLAAIEVGLMARYVRAGAPAEPEPEPEPAAERTPVLTY
jgi:cytochrome bd ubiquinol oxidase subunit I